MGLAEVLPHFAASRQRLNETVAAARALQPDAVVTVDSPDFCLRVCERLRGSGVSRDPLCRAAALGVATGTRAQAQEAHRSSDGAPPLRGAVLRANTASPAPMSAIRPSTPARDKATAKAFRCATVSPRTPRCFASFRAAGAGEVRRMLPIFGEALRRLKEKHPDLHVVIPVVDSVAEAVREGTRDWPPSPRYRYGERFDAFAAADGAMAEVGHRHARARACRRADGGRLPDQPASRPSLSAAWGSASSMPRW